MPRGLRVPATARVAVLSFGSTSPDGAALPRALSRVARSVRFGGDRWLYAAIAIGPRGRPQSGDRAGALPGLASSAPRGGGLRRAAGLPVAVSPVRLLRAAPRSISAVYREHPLTTRRRFQGGFRNFHAVVAVGPRLGDLPRAQRRMVGRSRLAGGGIAPRGGGRRPSLFRTLYRFPPTARSLTAARTVRARTSGGALWGGQGPSGEQ